MAFHSLLVRPFAKYISRTITRWSAQAIDCQEKTMHQIVAQAAGTAFGRDHDFSKIKNYEDFKKAVPIRDYEDLKPYVERVKSGELSVLWPGRPAYFAKTSGTTSGVKYIPMSKDSTPLHFGTARNAMFNYFAKTGKGQWLDGKMIFLSGSPELEMVNGIPTGRLSGISNHLVSAWLRTNQLPSWKTNCIDDWEEKLDRIVDETINADMRLISGIPPWVQMYYERLLERSGKRKVLEIFPNFSVFVWGGVNFEPYRAKLEALVGGAMDTVETYPASEGFIAFQDSFPNVTESLTSKATEGLTSSQTLSKSKASQTLSNAGLLLNVNAGMFFEFVPADEIFKENPTRLWLRDVEIGVNYALVLHTNAGLWGYSIGDTIQFVSKNPYRIIVSGRVKHFISAFGEHVIGKEVEESLLPVANAAGNRIVEFTVAPQVNPPEGGLPYHEWFVEFDNAPADLDNFALKVDAAMRQQNIYYDDLITGNILRTLKITPLRRDAFREFMKSEGKLGGQNKVPRLADDRKIADWLKDWQTR
ncbi:MAG: GH3 auxin-responsive promoter family protein [Saprospiraceae bacterium]